MKEVKQKLSLDRPATYQIKVPGELDESWSDWAGGMTIGSNTSENATHSFSPNQRTPEYKVVSLIGIDAFSRGRVRSPPWPPWPVGQEPWGFPR